MVWVPPKKRSCVCGVQASPIGFRVEFVNGTPGAIVRKFGNTPLRNVTGLGPAGSINSSIKVWLRTENTFSEFVDLFHGNMEPQQISKSTGNGWLQPEISTVKINCDAAFNGHSGTTSIVAVFRDSSDLIVGGTSTLFEQR
ncbi:hypothetical protein V6N12_075156 [Hibiscus sabdariffa]|uniref:Uncharacterized protein n=1 Tax=Hibiscus sabdariffa TaxID=183260 RepID=A0ABR2BZN1_9ROSI